MAGSCVMPFQHRHNGPNRQEGRREPKRWDALRGDGTPGNGPGEVVGRYRRGADYGGHGSPLNGSHRVRKLVVCTRQASDLASLFRRGSSVLTLGESDVSDGHCYETAALRVLRQEGICPLCLRPVLALRALGPRRGQSRVLPALFRAGDCPIQGRKASMTLDSDVLSFPLPHELDERVRQELETLVGSRIIGPAKAIGYDLSARGFSEPLTAETWWQRPGGDWVLATPRALDPAVVQSGGQMPAPPEVCGRIAELHRHGVTCDHVAVLQVLPAGVGPGDPLPDLVPKGAPALGDEQAVALSQAALDLAVQAVKGVAVLSGAAVAGGLAVGAGGVAALGGLAVGVARLDPILLGGIEHPEVPAVAWAELAHWEW